MAFRTDGLEPATALTVVLAPVPAVAPNVNPTSANPVSYIVDAANTGFCLDYQEK